jgi:hypothetical protein
MSSSAPRVMKQYQIPRNPMMPAQTALGILVSGSKFKTPDGKTEGYAMPLFRAAAAAGSSFTMHERGMLFYFKHGRIYIYDEARTAASHMFEAATVAAQFILPGLGELAGGMSKLVEKGGDMILEKVSEKIHEGTPHPQETFADQVKLLELRGMVLMPGANLVDVEYQVIPGGFLSKESHELTYSYAGPDGVITRYRTGAAMKGDKAALADVAINAVLTDRMWGEVDYLGQRIRDEYAPGFESVESEMRTAFERQHGEGSAGASADFAKAVNERYVAETERNGFSPATCGQRALELLAPMREIYDRTPVLSQMMQNFRAMAAGQGG